MSKPSILFVDDEPNILHGLKRFTRRKRDDWDLLFAEGGQAALSITQSQPVDVVVSDMRMPGLDGAELLQRVGQMHPGTILIMLSGEADLSQTYRTIGHSHRFLAKPCDPAKLVTTIEQILSRRPKTLSMKGSLFDRLLVRPETITRLKRELDRDDAPVTALTAILSEDANLAARLLQLTNSAYFGRPVETCSLDRAVETIGRERIRDLLAQGCFGLDSTSEPTDGGAQAPETLALLARDSVAAESGTKDQGDLAFALGLFSQLGCDPTGAPVAAYSSALLGLPNAVTDGLSALPSACSSPEANENCLSQIVEIVMGRTSKAA